MLMQPALMATDLPCACTSLRKASRAVSRVYDDSLAGDGMTVTQLAVLRAIGRAGLHGVPLSRLAEGLVMDSTSLYRGLGPLVRRGWVEIASAGGGRAKQASLTPAGRQATDRAAAGWQAAQSKVVEAFGVERWAALHGEIAALAEIGVRLNP